MGINRGRGRDRNHYRNNYHQQDQYHHQQEWHHNNERYEFQNNHHQYRQNNYQQQQQSHIINDTCPSSTDKVNLSHQDARYHSTQKTPVAPAESIEQIASADTISLRSGCSDTQSQHSEFVENDFILNDEDDYKMDDTVTSLAKSNKESTPTTKAKSKHDVAFAEYL